MLYPPASLSQKFLQICTLCKCTESTLWENCFYIQHLGYSSDFSSISKALSSVLWHCITFRVFMKHSLTRLQSPPWSSTHFSAWHSLRCLAFCLHCCPSVHCRRHVIRRDLLLAEAWHRGRFAFSVVAPRRSTVTLCTADSDLILSRLL